MLTVPDVLVVNITLFAQQLEPGRLCGCEYMYHEYCDNMYDKSATMMLNMLKKNIVFHELSEQHLCQWRGFIEDSNTLMKPFKYMGLLPDT